MEQTNMFFQAVKEGDLRTVEQMLARDPALVDAKNESGLSAVLAALYYGEPAMADLLIRRGATLNLFEACAAGRAERVQQLIDADPALVNTFAPDGFQPLGLAAFLGHPRVVELLLEHGAEVNSPSRNRVRVMPLHSAVAGQYLEIAKVLLEHGADVNARQADDFTPLLEAAQNGQLPMVQLLLAYGADQKAAKTDGQTPLSIAQEKGYVEIVALLTDGN